MSINFFQIDMVSIHISPFKIFCLFYTKNLLFLFYTITFQKHLHQIIYPKNLFQYNIHFSSNLLLFQPSLHLFLTATTTGHYHNHHHHCNNHKTYNTISDLLKQTPNHDLHPQQHKEQIQGNLKPNPPNPFKFPIHKTQIHLKSKSKPITCKQHQILTTKSKSPNPQIKRIEYKFPNP